MDERIERYLVALYAVSKRQVSCKSGRWMVDGENVGTTDELLTDIQEMNILSCHVSGFSAGF